jgi:hypothetical protein
MGKCARPVLLGTGLHGIDSRPGWDREATLPYADFAGSVQNSRLRELCGLARIASCVRSAIGFLLGFSQAAGILLLLAEKTY